MGSRNRKTIRLRNYNYSSAGVYFITICTKGREQILSSVKECDDGFRNEVILTDYGKIAEKYIAQLSEFYKDISVDKYVIMPNHIHLLLRITDTDDNINSEKVGGINNGPSGLRLCHYPFVAKRDISPNRGISPVPTEYDIQNSTVSKFISTFKRFCNKEYGYNIWQYRSNDHIIRNENDYQRIWQYINDNPSLWKDDCFYTSHF